MNRFFKTLLFIILASFLLTLSFNYLYEDNGIVVMGAAVPGSFIASTLFLICDYFFIKNIANRTKRYLTRGIALVVIFIIVVLIIMKIGDVWFDIQTYFNPNYGRE
jgi:uncharacterized BrkB/YihY/UPF0761 family membrane protein